MKRRLSLLLIGILLAVVVLPIKAQKASQLRLNEVLIKNETNYVDHYGNRSAWIEIYNTSAATVNIKGCYLTDDPNNLKKYPIPKGDVLTAIPPHQHLLFWADGRSDRGTFHLNFLLDPDKDNYIALVNADGSTVIDQVTIPAASIVADRSYGRKMDGKDGWSILSKVTPSTNNVTLDSNEKIDRLKNEDSIGGIMTITAMTVVFSALLMLSIAFMIIGRQAISFSRRRASKQSEQQEVSEDMVSIPGEVIAAMSMALKSELDDLHDDDSNVLTICRVERKYTPWSSKIYGLRQLPDRSMQPRFRK